MQLILECREKEEVNSRERKLHVEKQNRERNGVFYMNCGCLVCCGVQRMGSEIGKVGLGPNGAHLESQ